MLGLAIPEGGLMQRTPEQFDPRDASGAVDIRDTSGERALNGAPTFLQQLLAGLQAIRVGDFSARMPSDSMGIEGKIADAFNEIVTANQRMAKEFERVGQVVGREGKIKHRVSLGIPHGAWSDMEGSINTLIDDLLWPTTELTRAVAAVARGDASDTDTLLALGDAIVPAVSGYLSSADENVRTQAVALLAALGTESAAKALLPSLADSSAAIRERAARGILAEVMKTGKLAGLDSAVAKGLAAGEPGAAALLLGAFSEQSRGLLGQAVGSTRLVKLADASRPVAPVLIS